MARNFDEILSLAKARPGARVSVAAAEDPEVLEAIRDAKAMGFGSAVLVGDRDRIKAAADEVGLDLSDIEIIHEPDNIAAARRAVELVSTGSANVLMKGLIGTADLLRAVLDKEIGLRTGRLLSHVAVVQSSKFSRLILMTDGAMNIAPTLEEKADIIRNAVTVASAIGIEMPKVAALAAVELVNPKMQATIDAACLAKMADRGQIKGCIVDGPLGLDNAVSPDAASHKGVGGPVAGNADILLVPDIEAGNVLYKAWRYWADIEAAGVIAGAAAPIVLTSRSDPARARVLSLAVGILMA